LLDTAKEIRLTNRNIQKENGIDFIPSNDFSFYDNMLDAAVLLNAVPRRYKALELPELDTYFAMARGYQGEKGDVKALAMKKWFNTNYHYIVPEIDDETEITLRGTKPYDEFLEAQKSGVKPKPVVIGAFTFLKLAHFTGKKNITDFAESTAAAYCEYLSKFNRLCSEWVEFDEPYLVRDLSAEDICY
ncbi:MAG: 5-methyltetrahydropteroyltriglutamate--homocysteine S-methyltransferase, partial [Oscillospiraceae bacterium]